MRYKTFDKDRVIITLLSEEGNEISIDHLKILYVSYLYYINPRKTEVHRIIGRVYPFSTELLKFHILANEYPTSTLNLSLFHKDIISIHELRDRDIPLMINWEWIGDEIRLRYFHVE